ncbi:MAG: RDD family protein [Planctomycetota bacterium]
MRGVIAILLGLWLALIGAVASASVAGGGEGLSGWLWWVRPEVGDESVWVSVAAVELGGADQEAGGSADAFWFGRPADDGKHRFRPVRKAVGRVLDRAIGASADGRTLWACFRGGSVVSWRLVEGGLTGPGVRTVDGPTLPPQGTARALAVVDGVPWVLWRGDRADAAAVVWQDADANPSGLPGLAEAPADERERFVRDALLLKLPVRPERNKPESETEADTTVGATLDVNTGDVTPANEPQSETVTPAEAESEPDPEQTDPEVEAPVGRDVLLKLERGRWVPVALPSAWPDAGAARMLDLGDATPALVIGAGSEWTLWRTDKPQAAASPGEAESDAEFDTTTESPALALSGDDWSALSYTVAGGGDVTFVAAAGQAVGVGVRPRDAALTVLRAGSALRIGTLNRYPDALLPVNRPETPAVVGVGDAVALVELPRVRDPLALAELEAEPVGALSAASLEGEVLEDGRPLPIQPRPRTGPPPSQTILLAVLMASTLVMLVFWRKDPAGQSFRLEEGTAVASLDRRAIAGLIDVSLGFGVAYLWSGLGPQEILERWPGRGEALTWSLMEPAVVAIAATVLHTAIGEAVFARSLGKAALGLWIVDQRGHEARGWRALVRCSLKTLDLVAYLLLILLVVSPLRQRLGDLVAGTAVVMRKKPAQGDVDGFET